LNPRPRHYENCGAPKSRVEATWRRADERYAALAERTERSAKDSATPDGGYPVLVRGADWMENRIIYGLVDPVEPSVVRYVGQTTKAPVARYLGHLSEATNGRRRSDWVVSLREQGRAPDMVLLEHVPAADSLDMRELWWIAEMKSRGMADLNAPLPGWYVSGDEEALAKRVRINVYNRTGVRR
jgi:hypothetical protein